MLSKSYLVIQFGVDTEEIELPEVAETIFSNFHRVERKLEVR